MKWSVHESCLCSMIHLLPQPQISEIHWKQKWNWALLLLFFFSTYTLPCCLDVNIHSTTNCVIFNWKFLQLLVFFSHSLLTSSWQPNRVQNEIFYTSFQCLLQTSKGRLHCLRSNMKISWWPSDTKHVLNVHSIQKGSWTSVQIFDLNI